MSVLTRRLLAAAIALVAAVLVGTLGFYLIGGGRWGVGECMYMTIVSATTAGFGETLPGMDHIAAARVWAVVVILMGVVTFGFAAAMFTAFVVESDLRANLRKKAMRKQIEAMSGHMIVCGVGSTGRHVAREMAATQTPFVAIDSNSHHLEALVLELAPTTFPYVVGDASEDHILEAAGVARAKGLVSALPDDKDNLFVVVSARGLNPALRIISRGNDMRTAEKLRKAGAAGVVSPNLIGGMRLASEMLRPNVVEFLDVMLRDRDLNLRIEETAIGANSPVVGRAIRDANLRAHTDALILALRSPDGGFAYNPGPDTVLKAGVRLVVLGSVDAVQRLRAYLGEA